MVLVPSQTTQSLLVGIVWPNAQTETSLGSLPNLAMKVCKQLNTLGLNGDTNPLLRLMAYKPCVLCIPIVLQQQGYSTDLYQYRLTSNIVGLEYISKQFGYTILLP